jgi:hypothetical protein
MSPTGIRTESAEAVGQVFDAVFPGDRHSSRTIKDKETLGLDDDGLDGPAIDGIADLGFLRFRQIAR